MPGLGSPLLPATPPNLFAVMRDLCSRMELRSQAEVEDLLRSRDGPAVGLPYSRFVAALLQRLDFGNARLLPLGIMTDDRKQVCVLTWPAGVSLVIHQWYCDGMAPPSAFHSWEWESELERHKAVEEICGFVSAALGAAALAPRQPDVIIN